MGAVVSPWYTLRRSWRLTRPLPNRANHAENLHTWLDKGSAIVYTVEQRT